MAYQVIYLTGAPASGKSTLLHHVQQRHADVKVFEYGAELTAYLRERHNVDTLDQSDLRAKSSAIVTPEDVRALDARLLAFVSEHRSHAHVIIDSHPVTKEAYGFRVTSFSLADFGRLAPTQVWTLYASPSETVRRIRARAEGRPVIDESQAEMHTSLQASVAITYGMSLGVPVYFFDSDTEPESLCRMVLKRLDR